MTPSNLHTPCGHWHGGSGGITPRTWTPPDIPPPAHTHPGGNGGGGNGGGGGIPTSGIVIVFNALLGSAEGKDSQFASRSFSCNIPAGVYRVTLQSFDDHPTHPGQGQTDEAFYCKLYNGAGNVIYTTPTTNDIPDDGVTTTVKQVVDSGANISERVSTIRIFHKLYDSLPTGDWNSVYAVYAQFERLS